MQTLQVVKNSLTSVILTPGHLDTGRKLNVHQTFKKNPGCLLNVLCTFSLRPVSRGLVYIEQVLVFRGFFQFIWGWDLHRHHWQSSSVLI